MGNVYMNKVTAWAIIATVTRDDGTWFDRTITEVDDDTASSVDEFLTQYEKEELNEQRL